LGELWGKLLLHREGKINCQIAQKRKKPRPIEGTKTRIKKEIERPARKPDNNHPASKKKNVPRRRSEKEKGGTGKITISRTTESQKNHPRGGPKKKESNEKAQHIVVGDR